MLCRSPFCRESALDGGKFCAHHQALFDRVRYELLTTGQKAKAKAGRDGVAPTRAKRDGPSGADYERMILAALEDGPLSGVRLAEACGVTPQARTFSRARQHLCSAGKVRKWEESRQASRPLLYALPHDVDKPEQPQRAENTTAAAA